MNTRPGQTKGIGRWVARELSGTAMASAVLVATSGRWDWTTAWVLVGVYAVTLAIQAAVLIPRSPELLVERATRMRRGTKPWDRLLLSLYGLASLAVLVVAGLDARLG